MLKSKQPFGIAAHQHHRPELPDARRHPFQKLVLLVDLFLDWVPNFHSGATLARAVSCNQIHQLSKGIVVMQIRSICSPHTKGTLLQISGNAVSTSASPLEIGDHEDDFRQLLT
jgi:hypothetical protein